MALALRVSAVTISHPIRVTLSMASQAQVEAPNLEESQCLVPPMKSSQLSLVLALQQVQEAMLEEHGVDVVWGCAKSQSWYWLTDAGW